MVRNNRTSMEQVQLANGRIRISGGNLLISNTRKSDQGTYICVVSNSVGNETSETTLNVIVPLSVHVKPKEQLIGIGESATFVCEVHGHPITHIAWYKDGELLKGEPVGSRGQTGEIYIIRSVQKTSQGVYQCIVRNDRDSAQGAAYLRLKDIPPDLLEKFTARNVSPSTSVSLKCSASGNPPPVIHWSVDSESLDRQSDIFVNQFVDSLGDVVSFLNISRVTVDHSGNYKCLAKNRADQTEHIARLNIFGPLRIKNMRKMTVVAGESMAIACRVVGFPFDTITWEKDGMLLPADLRHRIHLNGTLTIRNVHQDNDSGQYTCVARSKENTQVARGNVDVMVLVQPKIAPFTFQNTDLYEGMRVQVMCAVRQGDLPINIRWFKNGQPLLSSSHTGVTIRIFDGYTSSLSIQSVTPGHNGNYTCVASNAAATVNFTAPLSVNVPPRWLVAPMDLSVSAGKDVTVPCSADGQPFPTISWMKADGDVPQQYSEVDFRSDPHLRILSNGTLYVQDARERDQGYYLCQASNGVGGGLSKVIFIDVQVPIYFEIRFFNYSARQGDNVKIVCDARGDVPIQVQWRKNPFENNAPFGNRFAVRNALNPNGVNSILEIENVEKLDSGSYRCEGENQFGKDAAEIVLNVMGVPDAPQGVKVTDFGRRHVDLSWFQDDAKNHDVVSYIVRYNLESGDVNHKVYNLSVTDGTGQITLSDLRPYSKYLIQVLAQNYIGISKPSETVMVTTLEEAPTDPPTDIQVEATELYTLKVTWKEPKSSNWHGELLGYNVGYRIHESGDPYVFRTTLNSYENGYGQVVLRGLQSYTKYDIVIQAYNRLGAGPSSDVVTATTAEDVPQVAPTNLKCSASSSSKSIELTWNPVQMVGVNTASLRYRVNYYITNNETYTREYKTTTNTNLNLHGLESYENYTISVTVFSNVGDGATSLPLTCHTSEDVPNPPAVAKILLMSSDSVIVSWKPPLRTNGVIVKYTIYNYVAGNMTKLVMVSSSDRFYVVKGLKRNQRYDFWMTASTAIGEGQSTKVMSIIASDKVPARIVNFGSEMVGILKGTIALSCQYVGDPAPDLSWKYQDNVLIYDSRFHKKPNGDLMISDLKSLDAGQYVCIVKNRHGDDSIKYDLKLEAPPIVAKLTVESAALDSITVKLNDKFNFETSSYTIYYKREFGDWESRQIASSNDRSVFTLDNLWCGTKYLLYITSNNKFGKDKPSEVVAANTKGGAPLKPPRDKIIRSFKNYATVNLNSWDDNGCPILNFVVEYKQQSDSLWNLVSNSIRVPRDSLVLPDLQADSSYMLKVTAHSRAGSVEAIYDFNTIGPQDREMSNPGDLSSTNNVPFYRDIKLVASIITAVSGLIVIIIVYTVCTYLQRRMLDRNQQESDPEFQKGVPVGCLVHDYQNDNGEEKFRYSPDAKLTIGPSTGSSTLPGDHTKGYHEDITPYATYRIPEGNNSRSFASKVWYEVPSNQVNIYNESANGF
ncbi:Down syndrome cell adhesion molecule-like protein 1 [Chamberlinius hualienensis]